MRVGRFEEVDGDNKQRYRQERWFAPAMVAMQQQADTVFLLTNTWGAQRRVSEERSVSMKEWFQTSAGKRWLEQVEKAKGKLAEENLRRKKEGQPPRVITKGKRGLVKAYFPSTQLPSSIRSWHNYTPDEMAEAFSNLQAQSKPDMLFKSGLVGKKNRFTFNVVHFVPEASGSEKDQKFNKIAELTHGEYNRVEGMTAIQSYVSATEGEELSGL